MCRISRAAVALGVLVILGFSGCTMSVYPVVGEKTNDLDLKGTWTKVKKEHPGPETAQLHSLKQGLTDTYYGTLDDQEFVVNVSKIGERYYLNARLEKSIDEADSIAVKLTRRLNLFARVELKENELHIYQVNDPQVHSFLTRHKLAFIDEDNVLVITETTGKLHAAIEEHGNELFVDIPIVYRREKDY